MTAILIYIFCGMAAFSALFILLTKNVLYAAYFLMSTLMSIAIIFILLNAEFIGVAQLMVYVGGVLVLLIFGIMLTNRVSDEKILSKTHHKTIGSIIGFMLFTFLVWLINSQKAINVSNKASSFDASIKTIGQTLMTDYILEFEVIGVLLLLVLIGAAFVAKFNIKHDDHEYSK